MRQWRFDSGDPAVRHIQTRKGHHDGFIEAARISFSMFKQAVDVCGQSRAFRRADGGIRTSGGSTGRCQLSGNFIVGKFNDQPDHPAAFPF